MASILVSWNPPGWPSRNAFYQIWFTPVCDNNGSSTESQETYTTTNLSIFIDNIDEAQSYIISVQAGNALGMGLEANITSSGLIQRGEECIVL